MRRHLLITAAALLCTACTAVQPPLADLRGRDQAQYNLDFHGCKKEMPFIGLSTQIDSCMERKGWTLLQ